MAVRQGAPDHSEVCVRDGLVISLGNLKQRALRTTPGQKSLMRSTSPTMSGTSRKVVALAQPAFHQDPVPRRGRQHRRRKMALTALPAGLIWLHDLARIRRSQRMI